jgi:hypothetical protein
MTADAVPDMTISISFGAVSSTGSVSAGRAEEAGPAPMTLESLNAGSATGAPAPMTASEMAAAQGQVGTTEPPGPMQVEQLATASSAVAPSPEPLGALETVGGPPGPLSLAELGLVDQQGTDGPPAPVELPAQTATPRKKAAGRER